MANKKDIVEQALKLIMGAGKEASPKAIRAYHVSPHDFDVFKPSEFRGSTFFSSTPERARRGAEAGRNEMVMETSTELPPVNWRTYEVEIDPSRIKGLSLTPSENKWFDALPGKIIGDDALKEATKGIPQGMYWDDFYEETPISEGVYEYTKKSSPPSMSYEEAINKNRDIYRQQWPHYAGTATDEKSSASRLNDQGMGGYLLQDEGGLSFAINDPNSVKIVKKYAEGGSVRQGYGPGGWVDDVVKMAGKAIAGEGEEAAKTGIRAYHGSPHDFDKFEWSPRTYGTGEGAQAYGHGLYFAENENIARHYRDALSPKNYLLNAPEPEIAQKYGQDILDMFTSHGGDPNELKDTINRLSDQNKRDLYDLGVSDVAQIKPQNDWGVEANVVNRADRLNRLQGFLASPDVKVNPGHIYEVDINADPNAFLDWDKPLSEQPEAIKKLFPSVEEAKALDAQMDKLSADVLANPNDKSLQAAWEEAYKNPRQKMARIVLSDANPKLKGKFSSGNQIYPALASTPSGASNFLKEAGIPGIKFLDAGSRGAGEGTRNYVVFDDKLVSIIRKYGIAGASAMLGYNLMENIDPKHAQAATAADQEYQASRPQRSAGGNNSASNAINLARSLYGDK